MCKRLTFVMLLLFCLVLPTHAVLKEKDLSSTLAILRQELTNYRIDLERQTGFMKEQQTYVTGQILSVLQHSQQNAIMLYSQRSGNIFDLTYACHEATEQYREFKVNAAPFREYIENANVEVARYDSLISDLSTMYLQNLSEQTKTDRNVCLTLAINIRRTLNENRAQMHQYVRLYEYTERQLKRLNDYANKRYAQIQESIFSNGGENYITILQNLRDEIKETAHNVQMKYQPMTQVDSDWDSRVILGLLGILLIGSLIAAIINYFLIGFLLTWLVKHNKLRFTLGWCLSPLNTCDPQQAFQSKRTYIILAATVFTFAILLGALRLTWDQNFIIMASSLLVEYAWLTGVILLSLLIRLNSAQIRRGFAIYMPIMAVCLIVISFRVILIPNDLVDLVFPPVLVACTIWQWREAARCHHILPQSDLIYNYISLVVFICSVIASVIGYTLLAVEMLIWWTMQLACILTLNCVASMLKNFGSHEKRRYFDKNTPITHSWMFKLIYTVLLPTLGAMSVILSIYWAADVFNLSDTTWQIFNMKLIDTKNFTFSIFAVVEVLILFFVFKFINCTAINLLQYNFWLNEKRQAEQEGRIPDRQTVLSRIAMWRNVIQVFVWGVWLIISMNLFNINNTWLVAISAGLSTGIGFAMKDILENIYYGISLMAGRIKVGDYISIEGTRGTVRSISYVSTMIEAMDGSVISFQNSQLFTKNYKNLTKNHGNEMASIPVGVSYGSNANEVRKIIKDAVTKLNKPDYINFLNVVFDGFGDNSIDFKILVWVDARNKIYATNDILIAVYQALNDHNIEIPFPQRDIHIVSDATRQNLTPDTVLSPTDTKQNH